MINLGSNKVSLRTTKDNINLGNDIASLYGGGGHCRSAGFQLKEELRSLVSSMAFNQDVCENND